MLRPEKQALENTDGDTSTSEIGGDSASTKQINKGYIFCNALTISLGFMQNGYGMTSYGITAAAFQVYFGWDDDEARKQNTLITSVTILGAAIGALSCSKLLSMGKRKLLFVLNLVLVLGVALTNVGSKVWLIYIGRLIWGYSFGSFSVCCAKMLNEITPIELSGPFGALSQFSATIGSLLPSLIALAYPWPDELKTLPKDNFWISQYYRVIFAVPLLIALV